MIVSTTGAAIALIFSLFPVLRTWFAGLTSEAKSGIMIGLMVLTAFAVWGAGCIGWLTTGMACTTASIPDLLKLILLAIVANQGVNRIVPEPADVKAAKEARTA
jgi:hypothetical protein